MSAPAGHKLDAYTLGLWRMGEPSSSNNFIDSSPNGFLLTQNNTPGVDVGQVDGCRTFSGSVAFGFRSPVDAALRTGVIGAGASVEGWLWLDPAASLPGHLLYIGGVGANEAQADNVLFSAFVDASRRLCLNWESLVGLDSNITSAPGAVPYSTWTHFAVVRSGYSGALYLNGEAIASTGIGLAVPDGGTTSTQIRIGSRWHGVTYQYWKGKLNDFRLSSTARTASEVAESYSRGRRSPLLAAAAVAVPVPAALSTTDDDEADTSWGTDIRTFPAFDGTMLLRGGRRVVAEAIARRWTTRRGQLKFHPEYGWDVRSLLSEAVTSDTLFRAKAALQAEAEADERVDECEVEIQHNFTTETATVRADVVSGEGPFRLTLSVNRVSAQMIFEE